MDLSFFLEVVNATLIVASGLLALLTYSYYRAHSLRGTISPETKLVILGLAITFASLSFHGLCYVFAYVMPEAWADSGLASYARSVGAVTLLATLGGMGMVASPMTRMAFGPTWTSMTFGGIIVLMAVFLAVLWLSEMAQQ